MVRSLLTCVLCVVVPCVTSGSVEARQAAPPSDLRPVSAPVRDAGVLHLASGTWTRKTAAANIGADIIYNNTCSTGIFYLPLQRNAFLDEGRIPSTSSPTNLSSRPGCANSYTVNGFQIAYCTDQIPTVFGTYTVNFYQSYVACSTVVGVTPTAGFLISGLPAASAAGALACWTVTIDLDSPPQSASFAFPMLADGNGSWSAPDSTNLFGWSMISQETAGQLATGPILAGDPNICQRFDGTVWDSPVNYLESGTGMGTLDQYRIDSGPTPGCTAFGSAFASFHLALYANACPSPLVITYCLGDGAPGSTPCPCGNHSPTFAAVGCLNSLGVGGRLRASGIASISVGSVSLTASNVPPGASMLFFQGTLQTNGGAGTVFGDGKRCASGTVIRLGTQPASGSGSGIYPQGSDPAVHVQGQITAPGVRDYQVWYRNAAAFCTSATFNLSNGIELAWGP